MLFRSTVEADLDRLLGCVIDEPISWAHPDRLLTFLEEGQYTHDRIWIAENDGEILAAAVWWAFHGSAKPLALDSIYVHPSVEDRVGLAADLLDRAHEVYGVRPDYHVFLQNGWHDDPRAVAAIGWRREVLARAGLADEVERLRYDWTSGAPVPSPSQRVVFRPEPDDEVFVQAFMRVADGSLDVHTQRTLKTTDPEEQARAEVAVYQEMPGDRSWWRLAYSPDGDLIGLAIPSANNGGPVVGYLGVVREHRGHGYVDDLLGEITRVLVDHGADRIVADTDTTNIPMAKAFERAGYRNFAVRLVISP